MTLLTFNYKSRDVIPPGHFMETVQRFGCARMRYPEARLTTRLCFACSLADNVSSDIGRDRVPIKLDIILSQISASRSILHIGSGGLLFSRHIVTIRLSGGTDLIFFTPGFFTRRGTQRLVAAGRPKSPSVQASLFAKKGGVK